MFPIDPRPGSDGPANFYIDANFQIIATSAAIDNAWEATAIPTDFLGNSEVKIPGGRVWPSRLRSAGRGGIRVPRDWRSTRRRHIPNCHHDACTYHGRKRGRWCDNLRSGIPDIGDRDLLAKCQSCGYRGDRPGALWISVKSGFSGSCHKPDLD